MNFFMNSKRTLTSFYLHQDKHFHTVVTMNLTGMLVLTTLFIANLNSLPRTPNIKLIDIWFIFTLLIPFAEVLLHTTIATLEVNFAHIVGFNFSSLLKMIGLPSVSSFFKDERKENDLSNALIRVRPKQDLNKITPCQKEDISVHQRIILLAARVGMPAIFVIFCLGFFTYAVLVPANHNK